MLAEQHQALGFMMLVHFAQNINWCFYMHIEYFERKSISEILDSVAPEAVLPQMIKKNRMTSPKPQKEYGKQSTPYRHFMCLREK